MLSKREHVPSSLHLWISLELRYLFLTTRLSFLPCYRAETKRDCRPADYLFIPCHVIETVMVHFEEFSCRAFANYPSLFLYYSQLNYFWCSLCEFWNPVCLDRHSSIILIERDDLTKPKRDINEMLCVFRDSKIKAREQLWYWKSIFINTYFY